MTRQSQRYVSPDLTHFVGRSLRVNEDAQYEVFASILTNGRLLPGGIEPQLPGIGLKVDETAKLCDDEMYFPETVCFCDIPVGDLAIHMGKYGRFALAFPKRFLLEKGANPVYYVARDARWGKSNDWSLGTYFNHLATEYARLRYPLKKDLGNDEVSLRFGIAMHVFGFIKCFDAMAAEADEANFYMEREWRVLGHVDFALGDVRRVILPARYFRSLRRDLPEYCGEVINAEDL
jgi:hypothetical protein